MPPEESKKEEGSFSFVDKRHRGEDDAPASRPVDDGQPASESAGASPAGASSVADFEDSHDLDGEPGEEGELKAPPIDFSTFILSMASNAIYSLGGFQDPVSGKTSVNLAQAKQAIDILSMIEEKTRGNLNNEEARLIKHILYDLRMKFVEASRK
ncbi:MAG: DUF1844 domain-containing protein [Nitrospinota bacterium]|nr:DUF1844 domain-containing protein [Nitrospinota bacterium]MDH5677147.1 DUF1844 domain-containing protein [Nitrospinota bacterium]MDH5757536.1 DUF1844 domain-containing protein [Nitrospinota bacterium]